MLTDYVPDNLLGIRQCRRQTTSPSHVQVLCQSKETCNTHVTHYRADLVTSETFWRNYSTGNGWRVIGGRSEVVWRVRPQWRKSGPGGGQRKGKTPPRQEQVAYVWRTEESSDLGAESEEMRSGRWAGPVASKASEATLRSSDFLLSNMRCHWMVLSGEVPQSDVGF